MFGETTISYVKIWNHPIEPTIYIWLFGVPGHTSLAPRSHHFFPADITAYSARKIASFSMRKATELNDPEAG